MTVKSIKHSKEKRVLIPSREEAGAEAASPKVKDGKAKADFPVNPVVHRGQDPELFWMHKYGKDDQENRLNVDIRSLYRQHIAPEKIIQRLYQLKEVPNAQQTFINSLFGNGLKLDEIDKVSEYYKHTDDWTNRLIQGDSLLVMTSLLEREGMAGKVQTIYRDPPYGIKYGSNWQMKLNNRNIKDGSDEDLSGEPEQIKAYRDTWELGIHSYLSYLRDRLLVAKEFLTESGSCFVQISDENVHLVRCLMDEVFGSDCSFCEFVVKKKGSQKAEFIEAVNDYVLWYGKRPKEDKITKFRPLYEKVEVDSETLKEYKYAELPDGTVFDVGTGRTPENETFDYKLSPRRLFLDYPKVRLFRANPLTSGGERKNQSLPFRFAGQTFNPGSGNCWKTTVRTEDGSKPGMEMLAHQGRLIAGDKQLRFKSYLDDFGYQRVSNWWDGLGGVSSPVYVVQTNTEIIERCLLMTTDPGDRVLDPTCGSGTTAFVGEQWGRWITIDTSRIALNIAKTRLLTATFPYYRLYDEVASAKKMDGSESRPYQPDIRMGFIYKKIPHITLKSIANDEPPEEETLYDQPEVDRKNLRVSGPFIVETLQNFEPVAPEELDKAIPDTDELENFEERIFEHMKSAGVKNGIRNEQAIFTRVDRLNSGYLHADGFYNAAKGEKKAYIHIGPKFGTVSRQAVNEAVKECRKRGDADWLIILGFSFLAATSAKRQAEKTLKIEIDDDAFARLYGHNSHPIELKKKGQKIAVRVISQFGEECTKVLEVSS